MINNLSVLNLFDFGLVVLVWIVQLVIYPSFKYFQTNDLMRWHEHYTKAITMVVLPLMLGQILLHGHNVFFQFSFLGLINFVLVLGTWWVTFRYAVPLHGKISDGQVVTHSVLSLINVNWWRTALWTLIFTLGFFVQ